MKNRFGYSLKDLGQFKVQYHLRILDLFQKAVRLLKLHSGLWGKWIRIVFPSFLLVCSWWCWLVSSCLSAIHTPFYFLLHSVAQSCPTLCNPMDCSLPGSSVHGIFQTRCHFLLQGIFPLSRIGSFQIIFWTPLLTGFWLNSANGSQWQLTGSQKKEKRNFFLLLALAVAELSTASQQCWRDCMLLDPRQR